MAEASGRNAALVYYQTKGVISFGWEGRKDFAVQEHGRGRGFVSERLDRKHSKGDLRAQESRQALASLQQFVGLDTGQDRKLLLSLIRFQANLNMLIGPVLSQIGHLAKLDLLYLGFNLLSGSILEISRCLNLTYRYLHSNVITGNLPERFSWLISLQFVDFSNNLIEGPLSPSLESLSSLTKLIMKKNRFSGPIPSQIGSLEKLQLLDSSGNELSGNIPVSLGKIPTLEITLNLG
ncbi:leucine-rich repeat receptor-like serine/threonine-protein kinase RGI4 [Alnus glutinosa]|uniref:leucine-rich repeat receptor-like serine/threonine-protein kinase RGI4 n=1 Tax=Alnus glutinosa TaxID=3517 RepID=UPI002D780983|nr:leucine-rich repeat receptor-like serine/threonine-protein kinase RGI4 [Alnus glutinosa]